MRHHQESRGRIAGVSLGLFILALFLASYSHAHPQVSRFGYRIIGALVQPIQHVSASFYRSVVGVWEGYISLVGLRDENERMHERLSFLESENSRLLEIGHENERLQKLLNMVPSGSPRLIGARVIGFGGTRWIDSITIDRGSNDGVETGMGVIQGAAVVGQIIQVAAKQSQVLLITDHSSGVDSIIQGSRARGVVHGLGSGGGCDFRPGRSGCSLSYVLQDEEVAVGDRVITSGMDGVFPKGLLVGRVSMVERAEGGLFLRIDVLPAASLTRIEEVAIVLPERAIGDRSTEEKTQGEGSSAK